MPHTLSKRQREYLEFIRNFIQTNEDSPRLEEIAEQFKVTPPTAHKMLDALQRKDTRGAGEGEKPIYSHITQTSQPHHRYCRKFY